MLPSLSLLFTTDKSWQEENPLQDSVGASYGTLTTAVKGTQFYSGQVLKATTSCI